MPQDCTGLALLDETKEFCKWNCTWIKKPAGRTALPKDEKPRKRASRSKLNNPKSICLVLEKDHIDFIKSQALQRSISEGTFIEPNELIREALQKAFPTPKQFDMFGARK